MGYGFGGFDAGVLGFWGGEEVEGKFFRISRRERGFRRD